LATVISAAVKPVRWAGRQAAGDGAAVPLPAAAPDLPPRGVALPSAVGTAAPPDAWLPVPSGMPLPSVPAPPVLASPPFSTVLPASMISWRNGWMPNDTPAMIAIPASATAGRSQPILFAPGLRVPAGPEAVSGSLSSRGKGKAGVSAGSTWGHAQCPCQVQYRTRSNNPARTLSSQGRGRLLLVLARIALSPSALGSTLLTAASVSRSRSWRPSSDAVMPSPACPPRHDVSCSRIDLRAAIARAVWLLTAPRLMPIALAMSASEKSA
jgi:hypothetical protein